MYVCKWKKEKKTLPLEKGKTTTFSSGDNMKLVELWSGKIPLHLSAKEEAGVERDRTGTGRWRNGGDGLETFLEQDDRLMKHVNTCFLVSVLSSETFSGMALSVFVFSSFSSQLSSLSCEALRQT